MAAAPAEPEPEVAEPGEEEKDDGPEASLLGDAWASSKIVRNRAKQNGTITRWVSKEAIGIPSVAALSLNYMLLEATANWFCPTQTSPRMIPIDMMRAEAW